MKTRSILILALQILCAACVLSPANAQGPGEKPKSLYDCLGTKFESFDTVLGTPTIKHTKDMMIAGQPTRESRTYGNKATTLYQVEQPEKNSVPTWIVIRFSKKAATW